MSCHGFWLTHDDIERYDRLRPRYPDAALDLVTCGLPAAGRVLDLGCGTGLLSAQLRARGWQVLGVEVDGNMVQAARAKGLTVEQADVHRWESGGARFDLVVCGQAWHWFEPARAQLVHRWLTPIGSLALLWNLPQLAVQDEAALRAVYLRAVPDWEGVLARSHAEPIEPARFAEELRGAGFQHVTVHTVAWHQSYSGRAWAELAASSSDVAELPSRSRDELLAGLEAWVAELPGGVLVVPYATVLVTTNATLVVNAAPGKVDSWLRTVD